jgi:hypothetical protein
MLGVLVSVLQLFAVINAFVRSLRDRFIAGVAGGLVRALLLVAGTAAALWIRATAVSGSGAPVPAAPAAMALAATILGPLVAFAALWLAHLRKKDASAAEEERLGRPFTAWLPVALFDAAFVAMNVFASVISNP